jgi:hypothetical protein
MKVSGIVLRWNSWTSILKKDSSPEERKNEGRKERKPDKTWVWEDSSLCPEPRLKMLRVLSVDADLCVKLAQIYGNVPKLYQRTISHFSQQFENFLFHFSILHVSFFISCLRLLLLGQRNFRIYKSTRSKTESIFSQQRFTETKADKGSPWSKNFHD